MDIVTYKSPAVKNCMHHAHWDKLYATLFININRNAMHQAVSGTGCERFIQAWTCYIYE